MKYAPKFLLMLFILVIISGCIPPPSYRPTYYSINISSFSQSGDVISHPEKFILLPANSGVDSSDLEFQEYARYVKTALINHGFKYADNKNDPDIAIFLSYGIGNPETHQISFRMPVYGQTGVSGSTTTGNLMIMGSVGAYSGNTTYTPTYGIIGYQSLHKSFNTYFRFVTMDAISIPVYKKTGKLDEVWKTIITSDGRNGDLREVMPILIAASQMYIGTDTKKAFTISEPDNDPAIEQIESGVSP